MDIPKLKILIDSDPANASKAPEQVSAWCNERVKPAPVPSSEVSQYLVAAGLMAKINLWSAQTNSVGTPEEAKVLAAIDMVSALDKLPSFDLSVPAYLSRITTALDALVTHGFILEGHKTQILSLGNNRLTRAEAAGLGEVWGSHVIEARK